MDHMSLWNPGRTISHPDCTHYCLASPAWIDNLENAITAVVSVLGEAGTNDNTEKGGGLRQRICVAAVGFMDRAVSTGTVAVAAAVAPVVVPAMVVLCVIRSRISRKCFQK